MPSDNDLTFASAFDLALRYHCKLPGYHEDDPRAALWIAAVAELPLAEHQGRLGVATREAETALAIEAGHPTPAPAHLGDRTMEWKLSPERADTAFRLSSEC
jgi:hypothetical protein